MMDKSNTPEPIYNMVEIGFDELARFPDGICDIYERRIDGLIIKGLYSKDEMATVLDRFRTNTPSVNIVQMPWGKTMGRVLIASTEDDYFGHVSAFRTGCHRLFEGMPDFEAQFEATCAKLSGGRAIEIAMQGSQHYTPATIRALSAGGALSLHCGNQFLQARPECQHLSTIVHLENQLSYFLTINEADEGGELILYDLEWGDTPNSLVDGVPVSQVIETYRRMPIKPGTGDLLLFDGGRIWHQVTAVAGGAIRVTLGGFVAFSKSMRSVMYWS